MGPTIRTGDVFARAFAALAARFGPLVGSVLVIYLPFLVALGVISAMPQSSDVSLWVLVPAALAYLLLQPLAAAAVIRGVFRHLRGQEVRFDDCWRGLGGLWLRVILLSILVGLVTGVGYLLCLIPGFVFQSALFVAIPILVVEHTGVGDAFNRSWSLTEGHRVPIFFIVLGLTVLAVLVSVVSRLLLELGGLPAGAAEIASQVVQAVMTTLQAVVAAVVYFDLREIREGMGLEDLASVFD